MSNNNAFIIYYQKSNAYSFNALIAAIEIEVRLEELDLYIIRGRKKLIRTISDLINSNGKVYVGISFFTTQLWKINELVKELRKRFSDQVFLIAGGPHPTGDREGTLKLGFDYVVAGEGEKTLIELLVVLINDKNPSQVNGVSFFSDNEYIFTRRQGFIDLNDYPALPKKYRRYGAIEITRGCPYACAFCQTSQIFGIRPRHRSIAKICEAVSFMKDNNKTDIRFITPNAFSYGSPDGKTIYLSKLESLLQAVNDIISPEGKVFLGSFPSEVRPEHVNEETLRLITTYCSNDNIIIGAQTGSQKLLDICHRGHKIEDVYKAVNLTIKHGLIANVDFIFGLPNEAPEDIDNTLQMIKDLTEKGAKIHTHTFMPLPNTTFSKMPAGEIDSRTLELIKNLNSKGIAYGEWEKQERLAKKIANYLKNKEI